MNVSEQDISITKHTLEKMWQNIQNEFNLNLQIDNKRKRYSTAAQLIGINTNIQ
jgi:hypothetical protein